MKRLLLLFLIVDLLTPSQIDSQEIRIPVIPFDKKKSSSLNTYFHTRCKSAANYSKCINRVSRKVKY